MEFKNRKYWSATNAWWKSYLDDKTEEIYFGLYPEGGGTQGEISVRWKKMKLSNGTDETITVPELRCFDDSWKALSTFPDLLIEMGKVDAKKISPQDFIEILEKCNFTKLKTGFNNKAI